MFVVQRLLGSITKHLWEDRFGPLRLHPNPLGAGATKRHFTVLDGKCERVIAVSRENCQSYAGPDTELVEVLQ